jgi:hypothetical protein
MIINKINNTTINANPPPYPPDMYVSPYLQKDLKTISMARRRNPPHLASFLKEIHKNGAKLQPCCTYDN